MRATRRERNEMRPHYDFAGGVRRKYAKRLTQDTIIVVVDDPDRCVRPTKAKGRGCRA